MNRLRAIVRIRRTAGARLAATLLIALTVLPFTAPFAVFESCDYTQGKSSLWDDAAGKDVQDVALAESFGSVDVRWQPGETAILPAGVRDTEPAHWPLVLRI